MHAFVLVAFFCNTFFENCFSGVANNSSTTKEKDHYRFDAESIYSARGWQFDRNSPYSGSPFASIDAIPGFDEDGLPSDPRSGDSRF